jgi:cell division septal protein FtsQ
MFNYLSSFTKHLSKNNINDKIIKIEENEIRSIKIFLYSGININFGSRNIDNRIKTFFKIYKKLKSSDLKKIRYIDMRYSNGFSIGWK